MGVTVSRAVAFARGVGCRAAWLHRVGLGLSELAAAAERGVGPASYPQVAVAISIITLRHDSELMAPSR